MLRTIQPADTVYRSYSLQTVLSTDHAVYRIHSLQTVWSVNRFFVAICLGISFPASPEIPLCAQAWSPWNLGDINTIESVQKRAVAMVTDLREEHTKKD